MKGLKHNFKLNIIFIFIYGVLFSSLLCSNDTHKLKQNIRQWTPEDIRNLTNYQNGIIDPEDYISNEDKKKIYDIIDEFKKERDIVVTFVIISEISNKYSNLNGNNKNIAKFSDDLSATISFRNRDSDFQTLLLVFSINDRQKSIRTGKKVKEVIDNYTAANYLKSVNSEMRSQLYGQAAQKILKQCFDKVMGRESNGGFIFIIVIFSILGCVWCVSKQKSNYRYQKRETDQQAESKLNRIMEITKRNKGKKEFLEKSCVICLEDLPICKNEINKLEVNKPLNDKAQPAPTTLEVKEHQNQKESSPLLPSDNNNNQNLQIAKLDCGHCFHPKCITEWMDKQNKCPVCRNIIDNESKPLGKGLVEIQSNMNPRINSYEISYLDSGLLTWMPPREYTYYNNNDYYSGGYNGGGYSGGGNGGGGYDGGGYDGGWNDGGGGSDDW